MDHLLDRPLAGVAASACVLCLTVAFMIFYRVVVVRPRRVLRNIPSPAPIIDRDLQLFTIAVATAFIGLAGMFALFVLRREEMIPWSTFETDVGFLAVFMLVVTTCLVAVWAATRQIFGLGFVLPIAGVAIAVGLGVWSLGIQTVNVC